MKYLLLSLILLSTNNLFACSPRPINPDLNKEWFVIENYNNSDLIFRGKFKNINIVKDKDPYRNESRSSTNVIISETHKGTIPTKLLLEFTSNGLCGHITISPDIEYLIYVEKVKDRYFLRKHPVQIEYAASDLKVLKEIKYKFTNPKTATILMYINTKRK